MKVMKEHDRTINKRKMKADNKEEIRIRREEYKKILEDICKQLLRFLMMKVWFQLL